jgi:undecaprenyl-phosphate 4-deoxy-4-formamido-L-arabinose transferase
MNSSHVADSIQYSVVVPIFRSGRLINNLLTRLSCQMDLLGEPYEIILVEDHGNDDSWHIMEEALEYYPQLRIIRLMRNFGQHNALMCGFTHCRGQFILTIDDDLQNPPEEIPKLIAALDEGYDVVYGVATEKKHHPVRNFGSSIIKSFYQRTFNSKARVTSFRIIRRRVIEGIITYNRNYTFIDGLIAWYTSDIGDVKVVHMERDEGRSGYSPAKLFTLTMNMVTNFSIIPLQTVSLAGIFFSLIGFLLALGYLTKYFISGIPVPGYTSIIIAITFLSGLQLLALGLIGEYLGRVHLNINSKPQYFIRESSFIEGTSRSGNNQ